MGGNLREQMAESVHRFETVVAPVLVGMLKGGKVIDCETLNGTALSRSLDMIAGIDGWHIRDRKGMVRGLAFRVQAVDRPPHNTFTIRESRRGRVDCELQKRLDAIKHDCLFPHLTLQAYVSKSTGELLSIGVVLTRQLMKYVQDHFGIDPQTGKPKPNRDRRTNPDDGTVFVFVRFADLKAAGVKCLTWP